MLNLASGTRSVFHIFIMLILDTPKKHTKYAFDLIVMFYCPVNAGQKVMDHFAIYYWDIASFVFNWTLWKTVKNDIFLLFCVVG